MEKLTDEQLIARYLKGDEIALEVLIKRYLPLLYAFSKRYTGDPDRAADIAQETFIKAWRTIKTFDQKKSFHAWIFTIAKNTALDWIRKKEALPFSSFEQETREGLLENIADPLPLPSAALDQKMMAGKIDVMLRELPEHYHSVVSMREKDGLTFREIATKLGKPLNTVKSHYRRAIALIKSRFSE